MKVPASQHNIRRNTWNNPLCRKFPLTHNFPVHSRFRQLSVLFIVLFSIIGLSSCSRKVPTIQQNLSVHLPNPGIFSWQIDSDDPLSPDSQFSPQQLLACGAFATPNPSESTQIHANLTAWRGNAPNLPPNLATIKQRGHLVIGIDSLAQPFSYIENQPRGLLVTYGQLLNQWLFPQSKPEFIPIHGYKDEAVELAKGAIDIALTPYPLLCEQVHTLSASVPFYHSSVTLAGFTSAPLTLNSVGEVCMNENPALSNISTTFYPHLIPIYAPATEYCQVLQQQGHNLSIIGLRESILSFIRQSTIWNLKSLFGVYFSALSSKNNLDLIQLINLAEKQISLNPAAQNALQATLITAGVLPRLNSLNQCQSDLVTLQSAVPHMTDLPLQLTEIHKNFGMTSNQYLWNSCLNSTG